MIFTIGHSTLKEQDFTELMGAVPTLIDVRSHPGSRAHPQFNKGNMEQWMPELGKNYEWWPGLGGWDVRHAQDTALTDRMHAVGVDLAVYSRGLFPKQRIAGYRLDMELIRRQLNHGCNCDIDHDIVVKALEECDSSVIELSRNSVQYLRQLYTRLTLVRKRQLHKKLGEQLALFEPGEKAPEDLLALSKAYQKMISSSSKLSKEISPCKWMPRVCEDCERPALAPTWWSQGLYDYSFFMTLPEFLDAADELIRRSKLEDVATCCCENLYYKCHRSLIADYCMFHGVDSMHIQSNGKLKAHSEVIGDRLERYPEFVLDVWRKRRH